jgi:8-oxo-dGTP pyrophosphatase MutT (NUDIX family)
MGKVIAAGIFLVNKNNEVLICHPTNHPQNVWSIPKGKVENEEMKIDAAIRETYEETNIDLTHANSFIPLEVQTYSHKKKSLYGFVVLEKKNPNIDFDSFNLKCNSNVPKARGGFPEMDDYKWVTLDEARSLIHETQVASIDTIQKLLKQHGLN